MIKNALLICESKSDNLGDQAISDAMIIGLKAEGYEVETADFSCRKSFPNQKRISFLVKGIISRIPITSVAKPGSIRRNAAKANVAPDTNS